MKMDGLERLVGTCQRLGLSLELMPPTLPPPTPGTRVGGHPLDTMLVAFHERWGGASFAAREAGLLIDSMEKLEERNQHWQKTWQERMAMPLFVFGGVPLLAHEYATVPGLADEGGCQPVVLVDEYEEPYALPVASTVDRLFDSYSHYLERLVATPGYEEERGGVLNFPWEVPDLLARDTRLVELIRGGCFASLLPAPTLTDTSVQRWLERILAA